MQRLQSPVRRPSQKHPARPAARPFPRLWRRAEATPPRCAEPRPPAPESPSSARWRAADSARPARTPQPRPADARSAPGAAPARTSTLHSRGICQRAYRRILPAARNASRRNARSSAAAAASSSAAGTRTLRRVKPSNFRAYSSSAVSPRFRTASRIGRTVASASLSRAAFRRNRRPASLLCRMRITAQFCSADIPRFPARPPASGAE